MHSLFLPYPMGPLCLKNRIVMAPLTRRRAENGDLAPNELMATYYAQRATAGLIVSEGSQISPLAYGYTGSPGCYSPEQVEGWKRVTTRLHEAGGIIFLQLWHVGPFSHPLLQPDGRPPVSASPVKPTGEVLTPRGRLPYETAREITPEEIRRTVQDFARATRLAMEAGFDGVEVHAAHAYLIDQFLMGGTNRRTDDYGGSVENRARFLFEVVDAVLREAPARRVGIRLSPEPFKEGMDDPDPRAIYGYVVEQLSGMNLAYLHLSEKMEPEERLSRPGKSIVPEYRRLYRGTLISCGGHSLESARDMIDRGEADLIAFGKPFISNPRLAELLKEEHPLAPWDKDTFYHGGARGYTDYP